MAGSPKKRARREAARIAKLEAMQAAAEGDKTAPPSPSLPALIKPQDQDVKHGEVLPPVRDEEVTRTAFKRAMRRKAAEHAEKAVAVLAAAMEDSDPEIARKAANDVLKWAGLDKLEAGELGGDGQQIVILRFGHDTEASS